MTVHFSTKAHHLRFDLHIHTSQLTGLALLVMIPLSLTHMHGLIQHGFVASKPVSSSFRVTVPPSPDHDEVDVATNVDDTDHGGEAKSSKAR